MDDKALDARMSLKLVEWKGVIHCVYLNDHRIAGGKPWGGGKITKEWSNITIRELAKAIPALRDELGLNYLGKPAKEKADG